MAQVIAGIDRIDRLKTVDLQYLRGDGCTYYLMDRGGRPQRTMFTIFIN